MHNVALATGVPAACTSAAACAPAQSPTDETQTPLDAGRPSLALKKRIAAVDDVNDDGHIDQGDQVTYSFTITNTGNVTVSEVTVSEPMLAAADVAITCPKSTLARSQKMVCKSDPCTITASDEAAGSVTNVATVSGTGPDGGPVRGNQSQAALDIAAGPDLPDTGSNVPRWLPLVAVGLLATGFVLVFGPRRRRFQDR